MKKILLVLLMAATHSNLTVAQKRDTLKFDTFDLIDDISYNPGMDKLLFRGIKMTGPYSYSSFIAIKDFITGAEEILPTYSIKDYIGYTLGTGEIYGWIDDQHVLIKQTNLPKDSTEIWATYNVHTMQCEEVKFEHEIKLNDDILVDEGAIIYMPWDASGVKNVYRYDFYSKKTSLYHTFNEPDYVILKAFSNSPDRLFYYSASTGYANYLDKKLVREIPKNPFGKRTNSIKILRYNFRYDDKKDKMYFITKVSRITDSINNMATPEAYLINRYDFQTDSLYTLDTIPISRENYWDIRGFEIFKEESLLLSVEKRLTEEEEQKNSIEGPVLNLKIWDMDVTIPTRLNTQKLLIQISAQQ